MVVDVQLAQFVDIASPVVRHLFLPLLQVTDECNKAERWLQEKFQQQDSLPKDVDPMVWSSEIKRKAEALEA